MAKDFYAVLGVNKNARALKSGGTPDPAKGLYMAEGIG